jgi:hypothetical protein
VRGTRIWRRGPKRCLSHPMYLMKTPFLFRTPCAVLGLLAIASFLCAAEPAFDFVGVLSEGSGVRVALKSRATGRTAWLKVGQTFDGYTVVRFDASTDTAMVKKDGAEFPLRLVKPKVYAGEGEIPPELKRQVLNNLRQLGAAADQYCIEHGVDEVTYERLLGSDKEEQSYRWMAKTTAPSISSRARRSKCARARASWCRSSPDEGPKIDDGSFPRLVFERPHGSAVTQ